MSVRERLPGVRSVATVLGTLVLVAALVPFVVFAVPQVVGADHGFVVLSGSMEPTTSPGDVVIVDASTAVAVGDVITFDDGNAVPTTHRVVGVEDGGYVTQGDANQNPDAGLVAPRDVLGEVTLTIPWVGHVILWVNTPVGYVSLVVAPLVLLLGNELFAWARRRTRDDTTEAADTTAETEDEHGHVDVSDGRGATVTVAVADLKLTMLAMAGLAGYAVWNVLGELRAAGAPDPISAGVLVGGLLGLAFALWVTVGVRLAARADRSPDDSGDATPPAETDGGTEEGR